MKQEEGEAADEGIAVGVTHSDAADIAGARPEVQPQDHDAARKPSDETSPSTQAQGKRGAGPGYAGEEGNDQKKGCSGEAQIEPPEAHP
jgi:hypothetical protein